MKSEEVYKFMIRSTGKGKESYNMRVRKSGWYISNRLINGISDRKGAPCLYDNLDQDCICYPSALPIIINEIWEQAALAKKPYREVQEMLDQASSWVRNCNALPQPRIEPYYGA